MKRVWLSGILMSLAAHLAVAAVLVLALELQPAGQQPPTGTRLTVSAVGVPHNRAVPRPLPALAVQARSEAGIGAPSLAMPTGPAPERAVPARPVGAGDAEGLFLAGRPAVKTRVRVDAPEAIRAVAEPPPSAPLPAATRGGAIRAAQALPQGRAAALPASGRFRVAQPVGGVREPALRPAGRRLAERSGVSFRAEATAPRPAATREETIKSRALAVREPGAHIVRSRRLEADARLAVVPADLRVDARALPVAALPTRTAPGKTIRATPPADDTRAAPLVRPGRALPQRPITHAPIPPDRLVSQTTPARPAPVAALVDRAAPPRQARPVPVPSEHALAATPQVPGQSADLLWSGASAPDPDSLTALSALTGETGAEALAARARIERALVGQPCSRVQARLDPAGPRLILRGHVPDLNVAGALMAALRARLGQDVQLSPGLATLPRPLCAQVAQVAALGLRPAAADMPAEALGQMVQSDAGLEGGPAVPVLRLAPGDGGFVHVDLYEADGAVVHLRPPPGTLPARHEPGDEVRLLLPNRAGQGPAVLAVMVTSRPLYLWPRAARESAAVYLRFLGNQAAAMRQGSGLSGSWRYAILPAASVPQ